VKEYFTKQGIDYTAISAKNVNARGFLKFVDIHTIPTLVIKEASGMTVLTGDKKIIAHFEVQSKDEVITPEVIAAPPPQSSTMGFPSEFLGAGEDAGCALTITETPSCADDNATPIPQH
jgi:hypothetical protein